MKLIVGLGNPGPKYAGTRHNVGFMVLDRLARAWSIRAGRELCRAKVGEGKVAGEPVRIAYPQTFMNASGESVACLMRRWRLEPADVMVIFDEVALPVGLIRVRGAGSSGGHLGLTSVAQHVQTEAIPRLRVGVGPPPEGVEDLTGFVLGSFSPAEKKDLEAALESAAQACETWVASGLPAAMNRFNRRNRNK